MGTFRFHQAARSLMTGMVMLAVLATTFLPIWTDSSGAIPVAGGVSEVAAASAMPVPDLSGPAVPRSASIIEPVALTPLNALILSDAAQMNAIETAIREAGDTLYVRSGDALFAGISEMNYIRLATLGARAVYTGVVPEAELAALAAPDRNAVRVWNAIASEPALAARDIAVSEPAATALALPQAPASAGASALYAPTDDQTSVFMAGDVAVRVLFVESNTADENWTEDEVAKVKKEVVQALDWWTVAPTVPQAGGDSPRPTANLSWDVSYVSPFDGTVEDRAKVQVNAEPIMTSIASGSANNGWMAKVAQAFTGASATNADVALRKLASSARGDNDWAFTLFVVDSSEDDDGRFDGDDKVAGAALNGPWAVVTYDGGDVGVDNLEILIAKMVGHVFGAGNEAYDELEQVGCHNDERYGYLRAPHTNCERANANPEESLMRAGVNMIQAYKNHSLSEAARMQLGWVDSDNDGLYDVLDTMSDSFDGFSTAPVCGLIHLGNVQVNNIPAAPLDYGSGDATQWAAEVWDPVHNTFTEILTYTPVTISEPSVVWANVNAGEWQQASATDGAFDSVDERFSIELPAQMGVDNAIYVSIMNQWEQQVFVTEDPVVVTLPDAPVPQGNQALDTYQSNDPGTTAVFNADGEYGFGWSEAFSGIYSGGATLVSSGTGSEVCFTFDGPEVSIIHAMQTNGTANVYVDGAMHSTLAFSNKGVAQSLHTVSNLTDDVHTVQVKMVDGLGAIDAFSLSDMASLYLIDGVTDTSADGFYETGGAKLQYMGEWEKNILLPAPERPDGLADGLGHRSSHAYDRVFVSFTNADTMAFYRNVFPGGGTVDVYVDGLYRGTMNNAAAVERVQPYYIGGFEPAENHTVELVLGQGTTRFELESVRFLTLEGDPSVWTQVSSGMPLKAPFTAPQEVYGKWKKLYGTYMRVIEDGAVSSLFFQGSAISVDARSGADRGMFEMYVDGALVRTVDMSEYRGGWFPIVAGGFDPEVPHVLQVRHVNAKPANPADTHIRGYYVHYVEVADLTALGVPTMKYEEADAYDADGNPLSTMFLYEGDWNFRTRKAEPGPSDDHYADSKDRDAAAYFYFKGADTFTIYANGGLYGAMRVYVDGVYQGLFSLQNREGYQQPFTLSGFDRDEVHIVTLRVHDVVGYLNKISLDAILLHNRPVLEPGIYEDNSMVPLTGGYMGSAIQFSGRWTEVSDSRASGDTYHTSPKLRWDIEFVETPMVQATFEVTNATSVVLYRRMFRKYGFTDVYVDGRYYSSFDNYTKLPFYTGTFQEPYTIAGLDPGFNHTITLKPRPKGANENVYKPIDLDYIEVRNDSDTAVTYIENGRFENNHAAAIGGGAISYAGDGWIGIPETSSVASTDVKGNKAVVVFKGNTFVTYVNQVLDSGFAVYIDGELMGSYMMTKKGLDVPYSIVGLENRIHVAEVVLNSGKLNINAFAAYTMQPVSAPATLDMLPTDPNLKLSAYWYDAGSFLETKEQGASVQFYVQNAEALLLTHRAGYLAAGDIQIFVDGRLHSMIERVDIQESPQNEVTYVVAGLGDPTKPHWIEIRNRQPRRTRLVQIEVTTLEALLAQMGKTPVGPGDYLEAEANDSAIMVGGWKRRPGLPNAKYSANYFMQSKGKFVHYYIPVQDVEYVTLYRPLSDYRDADVYVDGVFWGAMFNKGRALDGTAPFTIGPLPNDGKLHVIDLRETTRQFGLDAIEGLGMAPLDLGYYENDHPAFVGGYDARTGTTYTNAYTGDWTQVSDPQASGGSMMKGTSRQARLNASFYGNKLTFYYRTWEYGKYFIIYVDGTPYRIFTRSYPLPGDYQQEYSILLPDDGPHSLEIVNLRGINYFDAIEIEYVEPAYAGAYQHDDEFYVALNGDWETVEDDIHSGGSYVWTKDKFDNVMFKFYGSRVTAYMTTGTDWGRMLVYLDGKFVDDFDMHSFNPTAQTFFAYDLAGLQKATHVLELRFEGKVGDGKRQINFDGFTVDGAHFPRPGESVDPTYIVLPVVATSGCYEELDQVWTYTGVSRFSWLTMQNSAAFGGQYRTGQGDLGAEIHAALRFQADSAAVYYRKGPSGGYADIELDGAIIDRVDMYSATTQWGSSAVYTVSGLDPAVEHTLRVRFTGEKNPASSGTDVWIDRANVPATVSPSCTTPGIWITE